jgi:hypothetical protein
MLLKVYYRNYVLAEDGPLLATASIPGDGNTDHFDPPGTVEFFEFDTSRYPDVNWEKNLAGFRTAFAEEISSPRRAFRRLSLIAWSRVAFQNITGYGLRSSSAWLHTRCELWEDDGTKWDGENPIPLYSDAFIQLRRSMGP